MEEKEKLLRELIKLLDWQSKSKGERILQEINRVADSARMMEDLYTNVAKLYEFTGGRILGHKMQVDGVSYVMHSDKTMTVKFENASYKVYSDGTVRGEYDNGRMHMEKSRDNAVRVWNADGVVLERLPDGTLCALENGNIVYHETKGVEDTKAFAEVYLKNKKHRAILREMVAEKIDKRDSKNPDAPKNRVITNKTAAKVKVAIKNALSKTK